MHISWQSEAAEEIASPSPPLGAERVSHSYTVGSSGELRAAEGTDGRRPLRVERYPRMNPSSLSDIMPLARPMRRDRRGPDAALCGSTPARKDFASGRARGGRSHDFSIQQFDCVRPSAATPPLNHLPFGFNTKLFKPCEPEIGPGSQSRSTQHASAIPLHRSRKFIRR